MLRYVLLSFFVLISACASYGPTVKDSNYKNSISSLGLSGDNMHSIRASWYPNKIIGMTDSDNPYASGRLYIESEKIIFASYDESVNFYKKLFEVMYSDVDSVTKGGFGATRIMRLRLKNNNIHSFKMTSWTTEDGESMGKSEIIQYVADQVDKYSHAFVVNDKKEVRVKQPDILSDDKQFAAQEEASARVLKGKIAYYERDGVDKNLFSNTQKPTRPENLAITQWLKMRDRHLQVMAQQSTDISPDYNFDEIKRTRSVNQYVKKLAKDLCEGKITYGQFSKKKYLYETEYDNKINREVKKTGKDRNLAAENIRLKEEKQGALQDMQNRRALGVKSRNGYGATSKQLIQSNQIDWDYRQKQIEAERIRQANEATAAAYAEQHAAIEEQMRRVKEEQAIQALNNYVQQEEMQRQQQNMQMQQALQQQQQQLYQQQMLDIERRKLQMMQLQGIK